MYPDRIVLTATENPEHNQTVNWRTRGSVSEAYAQISIATDSPALHLTMDTVQGRTKVLEASNGLAHHHHVTFTDPVIMSIWRNLQAHVFWYRSGRRILLCPRTALQSWPARCTTWTIRACVTFHWIRSKQIVDRRPDGPQRLCFNPEERTGSSCWGGSSFTDLDL